MSKLIVEEYLSTLKEDTELDYIFPILLKQMGHKIISTPKDSKGQSQYGKDVISIGKDESGQNRRFYFELKGEADKDVDAKTFNKDDGIRMSLLEAKDTLFKDSSIPNFNSMEICVVLVHNGVLKSNFRPQFEGFITQNFKEGEFQHWDINRLTDLFSEYLFDAYLLTDPDSLRLFKKFLVLLNVPEYDFIDFKQLIDLQIKKATSNTSSRAFNKFFATQNLLASIVHHYAKENNNLESAKECISYIILKTWGWILKEKLEGKKAVIERFRNLLQVQYNVLSEYFDKTFNVACLPNGLFSEQGGYFEAIGYPLRSFEYINYLTYFFKLSKFFEEDVQEQGCKLMLFQIITRNDATRRPIIDINSIAILNAILYTVDNFNSEDDNAFLTFYLNQIFENIVIIKKTRDRYPSLDNNIKTLIDYAAKGKRPYNYSDDSSLLITVLFDLLSIFNGKEPYEDYRKFFIEKPNLQIFYPDFESEDIEQLLFDKEIREEGYVEVSIKLEESFEDFQNKMKSLDSSTIEYRTDKVGFSFLRHLAHIYYKTPYFPYEWRRLYSLRGEDSDMIHNE